MPKGQAHSGEFKEKVIKTMREEELSFKEAAREFGLNDRQVRDWEKIYLSEGAEGLYEDRRGKKSGRRPKLDKQAEEDLIAENQRLRAEVAYLKNLQALVLEDERRRRKKYW